MFLHPDILVLLRRAHIPVAVVLTESPYDDAMQQSRVAPFVELLWTNERTSVDVLRQINLNTHYLPHAYDSSVHHADTSRDPSDVPSHDVVFVGSQRVPGPGGLDGHRPGALRRLAQPARPPSPPEVRARRHHRQPHRRAALPAR
jgi:hypothetical protein